MLFESLEVARCLGAGFWLPFRRERADHIFDWRRLALLPLLLLPLKWGLINANAVIAVALPSVYYCFLSFHLECSAFVLHCRRRRRRSWYLIDCQVYSNWPIQSSLKCCWLLTVVCCWWKRKERLAGLLWLASVIRLLVKLLAELWWPVQSVTGAVDSVEVKTK